MGDITGQLRDVLRKCFRNYSDEITYHIEKDIDQAEQAILALFMECLPEQQTYGPEKIDDWYAIGYNKAIDITAQHMRALGGRDEPIHV